MATEVTEIYLWMLIKCVTILVPLRSSGFFSFLFIPPCSEQNCHHPFFLTYQQNSIEILLFKLMPVYASVVHKWYKM